MENKGVISVIVPVYGVEKYVAECIESILGQTYGDLEVILIDDGSPDHSGEICDRYAQADSRVLVLHQKNGGAAAARNAGLAVASGAYLMFVDGDDYLEPEACETMLEALTANDADIVHAQFQNVYPDGTELHAFSRETAVCSASGYLLQFWEDWTCALLWNKIFTRSVVGDLRMEEGHRIDDEFFTYQCAMNAERILRIPAVVYNYRQRASSVMKDVSTTEAKCQDILAFLDKRNQDVCGRFPALKAAYEDHYADYLLWLAATEMGTKKTVSQMKMRLLRHVVTGKSLFWKKGQRKRFLRILSFLVMPANKLTTGKEGAAQREHQLFE